MRKNAKFQSKAGLRPRIIRKAVGKCCEWCQALAGKYDYPDDVPRDVYRRHANCNCTVEYDPGVGKRVQDVWSKRWTRAEESGKIEKRKKVEGIEKSKPFVPVTTIQEAEQYARQFAGTVSFSGANNIRNINAVNKTLTELTSEYPIEKLSSILTSNGPDMRKANARANGGCIKIKTSYLNNPDALLNWKERICAYPQLIEEYQAAIDSGKYSKSSVRDFRERIKQMQKEMKFSRWSISSSSDSGLGTTIAHEYGHVLADQRFGQLNGKEYCVDYDKKANIRQMVENAFKKAKFNGDIYDISMYAESNSHEFFSECFAAYWNGEKLPYFIEKMLEEALKQ